MTLLTGINMSVLFLRIVAILFLSAILYTVMVFLFPHFTDTYGIPEINTKIRNIKNAAFTLSDSEGNLQLPF